MIRRVHHIFALLGATLAMLLAAVLLATPAHAAGDPVERSITRALQRGQVTPREAVLHRRTWRASGSAARRLGGSRRREVEAVRSYTRRLARSGMLTPQRLEPVLLSVKATTYVMRNRPFPSHESKTTIPGELAVFKYYSGRGVQFQPFETFKEGYGHATWMMDPAGAKAIADRMLELGVRRNGALTWEYHFAFGGPSRPWVSSISQALGTEFLQLVAEEAPAEQQATYAAAASSMLRLFVLHPTRGGVAVGQGSGRWYLIYDFNRSQRILNGHLQVLVNLSRYVEKTGSRQARGIVARGTAGVVPILHRFDTGSWSNYQYGQEADLDYHKLQTGQLEKLGALTGVVQFQDYAHRFRTYLETPPVVVVPPQRWLAIYPAPDRYRDTVTVRYRTDKRSRDTIRIYDEHDRERVRFRRSGPEGGRAFTWNGRDWRGRLLPDGAYTVKITATDVAGNYRTGQLTAPLRIQRDRIAPTLTAMSVRASRGGSLVVLRTMDGGSAWVDAQVLLGGRLVATRRGPRAGTWGLLVDAPPARVRRGVLAVRDSSGNRTARRLG